MDSQLYDFFLLQQVPGTYAKDPVLGRWVGTQRTTYRRGQMSQDRIEVLESLGFQWRVSQERTSTDSAATSAAAWSAMFEKLKTFQEEKGMLTKARMHLVQVFTHI